ncbi:hypothetical protein ACFQ61_14815 [Streptomyces sp. NPDC056500]|uniref:hypothetical protein n=1 Tax=Streptomyces sp. NPDC056500 TaxID=3345840 RepID=UPI0036B657C8
MTQNSPPLVLPPGLAGQWYFLGTFLGLPAASTMHDHETTEREFTRFSSPEPARRQVMGLAGPFRDI